MLSMMRMAWMMEKDGGGQYEGNKEDEINMVGVY